MNIYCDGSSLGNPGAAGWSIVIPEQDAVTITDKTVFYSGGEKLATNNSMELIALMKALSYCADNNHKEVTVFTDSKYVLNCVNTYMHVWKDNGWKHRGHHHIPNANTVKEIYNLCQSITLKLEWIKGHSGNVFHDFADSLAGKMAAHFKSNKFATYQHVELTDKVTVNSNVYKVNAKFIATGIISLWPLFNPKLKPLVLSAEEFDSMKTILI